MVSVRPWAREVRAQAIETQHAAQQMAAFWALLGGHFAQKINANLSQIFENTIFQAIFFEFFLLTMEFCYSREGHLKVNHVIDVMLEQAP